MAYRLIFFLVLNVFSLLADASQENYPFSVVTEKEGDGHRIVARNAGPSPVSVRVSLTNSYYINSDRSFPIVAVVPPSGGLLYLAHIRPMMSGVGYTFSSKNSWILGDYNARQAPDAIYRLPYRDGQTFRIGQAPGGPITTHKTPESSFAVDIPMPEGTPIVAARDGTVIYTESRQKYGAQIPDMMTKANEIKIRHVDGTIAVYAHLAFGGVYAYPGQSVKAGEQIGLAGSTGYSSGPHLHFAVETVMQTADGFAMQSLPFRFYLGNPAVAFSPAYGMIARAEYVAPGQVPGMAVATQLAPPRTAAAPIRQEPRPALAQVSFEPNDFIGKIRHYAANIPLGGWLALAFVFILYVLRQDKLARQRQIRDRLKFREPTVRK